MTKFEDEIYMVCLCEQKKRDLGIPKELFSFFNFSSFIHFGTLEKCLGRDARGDKGREGRERMDLPFYFTLVSAATSRTSARNC